MVTDPFTAWKAEQLPNAIEVVERYGLGFLLRSAWDYQQKTIDELREMVRELESKKRMPDWTCSACGSSGPFRDVRYDVPGEPVEHDMECQACGSLDIRESASEAAKVLGDRFDTVWAERETLTACVEAKRDFEEVVSE